MRTNPEGLLTLVNFRSSVRHRAHMLVPGEFKFPYLKVIGCEKSILLSLEFVKLVSWSGHCYTCFDILARRWRQWSVEREKSAAVFENFLT